MNKEFDLKKHSIKLLKTIALTFTWGMLILILLMVKGEIYFSLQDLIANAWMLNSGYIDHLWFMQALVVVYIFAPIIIFSFQKEKSIFYYFFATVMILTFLNPFLNVCTNTAGFLINQKCLFSKPFNFFSGYNAFRGILGFGIGYFMLGGLIFSFRDFLAAPKYKLMAIFAIPFSTLLLFLYGIIMSISANEIFNVVWRSYDSLFALINLVAIFILVMRYKHSGFLGSLIRVVGENTLGIYLFHLILLYTLKPIYLKFAFASSLFPNILFGLLILFLSTIVCVISKKIPLIKYLFSL